MPRPKKIDGERRTALLRARVTLAEKLFVVAQATKAGQEESEYLRRRALGLPVSPAPSQADAALISELNRIGVNVNQLARSVNSGRNLPGGWQEIAPQLEKILAKIAAAYGS